MPEPGTDGDKIRRSGIIRELRKGANETFLGVRRSRGWYTQLKHTGFWIGVEETKYRTLSRIRTSNS
jgi:hypothetical protein